MKPGDLFHVPASPHDSWVVGEEPYLSLLPGREILHALKSSDNCDMHLKARLLTGRCRKMRGRRAVRLAPQPLTLRLYAPTDFQDSRESNSAQERRTDGDERIFLAACMIFCNETTLEWCVSSQMEILMRKSDSLVVAVIRVSPACLRGRPITNSPDSMSRCSATD